MDRRYARMRPRRRGPLAARLDRLAAHVLDPGARFSRTAPAHRRRHRCASAFVRSSRTPAFSAGRPASSSPSRPGRGHSSSSELSSSSRTGCRLLRRGSCSAPVPVVYVPGNLLFRRLVDDHGHLLLIVLLSPPLITVADPRGGSTVGVVQPRGLRAPRRFSPAVERWPAAHRGLDLAPELRLGITGVRTVALQGGYFVGAAVGGVALAAGGYSALGLTLAAMFAGAAVPHLLPAPLAGSAGTTLRAWRWLICHEKLRGANPHSREEPFALRRALVRDSRP